MQTTDYIPENELNHARKMEIKAARAWSAAEESRREIIAAQ